MGIFKKPIVGDCGNVFTRKIVEQSECGIEGSDCNMITHNDTYDNLVNAVKEKCKTCIYRDIPVEKKI